MPYLGSTFVHYSENIQESPEFNSIVFLLSADKTLIFNTKFPEKLTLFYYDLLFLLNVVYNIPNENTGKKNVLKFTDWFLPVCINNLPDDFYGLGLDILALYAEMIPDETKKSLLNKLSYIPAIALLASTIKMQNSKMVEFYRKYISKYDIDGHDKSIPMKNFLNIGIALCIRCTEECNKSIIDDILQCIELIKGKLEAVIADDKRLILGLGLEYAKMPSEQNKKTFVNSMKNTFLPYQARDLLKN